MENRLNFSNNPLLRRLRNDAIQYDEWATKRFWEYILNKIVFKDEQYIVSSEQPPAKTHTQRRVDIVVEKNSGPFLEVILVNELKKGGATEQDIREVESQGWSAAEEMFMESSRSTAWVMTCYGPKARFWHYDKESGGLLQEVYPSTQGNKKTYVDIDGHQSEFAKMFEIILKNPIPNDDSIAEGRKLDE